MNLASSALKHKVSALLSSIFFSFILLNSAAYYNSAFSQSQAQVEMEAGSGNASTSKGFAPKDLSISVGTTVTWMNRDAAGHTVTSGNPGDTDAGSETKLIDLTKQKAGGDSVRIFVNNKVINLHTLQSLTNNEPALAKKGNVIFYTGNDYAARSQDGGKSWTYVDPFKDMPDFSLDQDALYDYKHGIFIWYRQGWYGESNENRIRVSVSNDASTWWSYDFTPTDFNKQWTNDYLDYPQLSLSNNYLYFTTDVAPLNDVYGDHPIAAVIVRIPLDILSNDNPLKYDFYVVDDTDLGPVQGATDIMYFALRSSEHEMTIYEWPESSSTVTKKYVREIPYTTYTMVGQENCPTPDGNNWCGRSTSAFTSGWKINDVIGFLWTAGKGGNFPQPYVDAATFRISNMTYLGRPLLWSPDYAWQYAYAYPNARGELAIIAFYGGAGKINPSIAIGVSNNYTDTFSHWEMYPVISGTNGPSDSMWGDYLRIRPFDESGNLWIASAFTLQGGTTGHDIEPRYLVFGFDKDASNAGFTSSGASGSKKVSALEIVIPLWIKNNAKWWSQGKIGDSDFVQGIQYLIKNGIMKIPQTQSSSSGPQRIPAWIKSNAGWWADDKISDGDFVSGIQYLISNGMMKI